jgi:glutamate synthase (NADPH) small chain
MSAGFLEHGREDLPHRPVEARIRDFAGVEQALEDAAVLRQAGRCMECGTPFCHGSGCPLGNIVPEINRCVARGRWREALDLLLARHPFPEFTARICPAPCEAACVLGIHDDSVAIRALEWAVIERGFREGWVQPVVAPTRRRSRVAVVGSGPAGLAAAQTLNRAGYDTVVYERAPRPGGILRYGIPAFKLEKAVVDRRIRLMEKEGVVFESGVEAGEDLSVRYLLDRFDALIVAGGSRQPRDLAVPGRELRGIHTAMTYLVQQNRLLEGEALAADERLSARDKHVVVIGGGDTGADCLGTALRQGARSVVQLEIMPRPPLERPPQTPWPLWPNKLRVSTSHEEGGERRWSVSTTAFAGQSGRVAEVRGVEVEWVAAAAGERPSPRPLPGTECVWPCDLALLALGFVGPVQNRLYDELALERDGRGAVLRDDNGMTRRPGVFVVGDMALGASLVVRAIADGRRVAQAVAQYLGEK